MNRFLKILIVLPMILFLQAGPGYTDSVLLRNGDKLVGDIQNEYFAVRGSYSQIAVKRDFCKNITMNTHQRLVGSLKTINNDVFSGTLLNKEIQILLTNATRETVNIKDLDSLFFENFGSSRPVLTTIFTMGDGDRFSGKMLSPEIKIRTQYMTAAYTGAEINRIEFAADGSDKIKLLLINGDIIQGNLLLDEIRIEPNSCAQLTADKSKFSSIQFNARKRLLKEYGNSALSEQDGDGDGVSDQADNCPNTPWGHQVDLNGCSTGHKVAQTVSTPVNKRVQAHDEDGDGVPDDSDKCPQTPFGVKVDGRGCWLTQDILFDFDSALVKGSYYRALDHVVAVLNKNPALKIEVQGSADNIGSSEYNQMLSQKRARAVKKYLVDKGIEPARIIAVGYGLTRQAASNATAHGRALNRRTDFMVIEQQMSMNRSTLNQ